MAGKENFSFLDGVPFAIGPKFYPPENAVLPLAFHYEFPPELLIQKYDFDVENKIIKTVNSNNEETETSCAKSDASLESVPHKTLANHGTLSWNSNFILQPQSQVPNKNSDDTLSTVQQNVKKINLSDFENQMTSPFDYMELQTINDLEELNTVFQGMCKNQKETKHSENDFTSHQTENTLSNVSKSISFPSSQNDDFSNHSVPISSGSSKSNDSYLSYSSPNMPTEVSSLPMYIESGSKRNSFHGEALISSALPQVPSLQTNPNYGYDLAAPPTSLRSSKSIPDLTNVNPLEVTSFKTLRSHTPPASKNIFVPDTSNHKIPKLAFSNSLPNNCMSNKEVPTLPDPYNELNDSEKIIVDSIYAMGFNRGQVSRTVKHLGTDQKKVIDHLCQIQVLEESGYDRLEAEAALHLHDYNKDEAIQFLDLLNQFQDLGFEKDAIKKALVQNKNNRDKVIDALLSSS